MRKHRHIIIIWYQQKNISNIHKNSVSESSIPATASAPGCDFSGNSHILTLLEILGILRNANSSELILWDATSLECNFKLYNIWSVTSCEWDFFRVCLGEPSKLIFGKSWAFGPTSGPPHLPISWAAKKKIECLFCILGYSKQIIFSWKK